MSKDQFPPETKLEVGDITSGGDTNISQEEIGGDKVSGNKTTNIYNQLDSGCEKIAEIFGNVVSWMQQQIQEKDSTIHKLEHKGETLGAELSRLKTEKKRLEEQVPKFMDHLDSFHRLMKRAKAYKEVRVWLVSKISAGISREIGKEALDKIGQVTSKKKINSFYRTLHEYLVWIADSVADGGPIKRERPKPVLAIDVYAKTFECLKHKADADLSSDTVKELVEFLDYLLKYLSDPSVFHGT